MQHDPIFAELRRWKGDVLKGWLVDFLGIRPNREFIENLLGPSNEKEDFRHASPRPVLIKRICELTPIRVAIVVVGLSAMLTAALVYLPKRALTPIPVDPTDSRPNLLLVTFDTLRADFLACYGSTVTNTPHFDRLASHGVLFERAYATAPFTPPSLWSLLHSVRIYENTYETTPRKKYGDAVSFVERLQAAGYMTAGFTGSSILNRGSGFEKGFEHYEDTWSEPYLHNETTLQRLLSFAQSQLERARSARPYFLYVHFYDPHGTWGDAPSKFNLYPSEESHFGSVMGRKGSWNAAAKSGIRMRQAIIDYLETSNLAKVLADGTFARLIIPSYRAEITWSDDILGRLLARLSELGALDNTVVVVTSDHGYSFLEHYQRMGYVFSLFDEAIRVPLIIATPWSEPNRIEEPVSLLDIGATVLDYAGVATTHGEGRSLRDWIDGVDDPAPPSAVYAEATGIPTEAVQKRFIDPDSLARYAVGVENRHAMLVDSNRKLILMPHRRGDKFELFDLRSDPEEQTNIFLADDPEHRNLAQRLLLIQDGLAQHYGRDDAAQNRKPIEWLRALGYID